MRRAAGPRTAIFSKGRGIMNLGLKGRKALVTGSTKGIGRAITERLIAEGCDVAICARTGPDVDRAVAELEKQGAKVVGRPLDVADGAALGQWIADAGRMLGGLDIFVANASALADGHGPKEDRKSTRLNSSH